MAQQHRNHLNTSMETAKEIARLGDLDLAGLQRRWRSLFRQDAPPHLPRHLLLAIVAYRVQANVFGDLNPATARFLAQIGSGNAGVEAVRSTYDLESAALRPGTILMREWNDRAQRVTVTAEGFVWQGKTFDSLSAVAFAVTGTKWNGHRFFGLRDKTRRDLVVAEP